MNEIDKLKKRLENTKRLSQKVVQLSIPEIESIVKEFDQLRKANFDAVSSLTKQIDDLAKVEKEKELPPKKVVVDVDQGMFKERK